MAFNPTHHETNFIHTIHLGDTNYEIHDAYAVHTLADLADLGMDTSGVFVFKGTVGSKDSLPKTGNKVGYVYHVTDTQSEYVWAIVDGKESWEEFGEHFVVNHVHPVIVTGTNADSEVTGTATVTGGNSTSSVSGSASISNVPTVSDTAVYTKVNAGNDTFVKSYSGETKKMVTTSVTPAGAATSVISSVDPSTGSIIGVSGSTTASKAKGETPVDVAKVGTAVNIPNVTGNTSVTASKVTNKTVVTNAEVDGGVLTISFGNSCDVQDVTATNTTLGTAISVTPAVDGGQITPYTFTDVTVPVAATAATTVVTGVSTNSADVATVGSAVTLATGALATSGAGSAVMTSLGTATTASALTSAALVRGTEGDGLYTGDEVSVGTQTLSGTISGTAAAQVWTQNTGSISGTAAAQTWTQTSGVT